MTTEVLKKAVAVKADIDILAAKVKEHERALKQLAGANNDGKTNITYKFVDPSGFFSQDSITIRRDNLMSLIDTELDRMTEELKELQEEFAKLQQPRKEQSDGV